MANHGDFVTPPPLPEAQPSRLAMVWEGNPEWTATNLALADTQPGDSSINISLSDGTSTKTMPLDPKQARELAAELAFRAGLLYPKASA